MFFADAEFLSVDGMKSVSACQKSLITVGHDVLQRGKPAIRNVQPGVVYHRKLRLLKDGCDLLALS